MRELTRAFWSALGLLSATLATRILGIPAEPPLPLLPAHPREEQINRLLPALARARDSQVGLRVMGGMLLAGGLAAALFTPTGLLVALGGLIVARWGSGRAREARERLRDLLAEREAVRALRAGGHQAARSLARGPARPAAEAALRLYAIAPRVPVANDATYRGEALGLVDALMHRLVPAARAREALDAVLAAPMLDAGSIGRELALAKESADPRRALELKARLDSATDLGQTRERARERARVFDEAFVTLATQLDTLAAQLLALAGPELSEALDRVLACSAQTLARIEEAAGVVTGPAPLASRALPPWPS